MITAKNITTAKIDFSKLPAKFKEDFPDIKEMAPYHGQDKDITEAIDKYVAGLNAELGKAKPKAARKNNTLKIIDGPGISTAAISVKGHPEFDVLVNKKGQSILVYSKNYDNKGNYKGPSAVISEDNEAFHALGYEATNPLDKVTQKHYLKILQRFKKKTAAKSSSKKKPVAKFKEGETVKITWGEEYGKKGIVEKVREDKNGFYYEIKGASKVIPEANISKIRKPVTKKNTANKRTQSKAEAAKAKKAYEADKAKAVAGEFAGLSRNEVLAIAQRVHRNRRLSAQIVDEGVDHKNRLTPTPENLVRWMKEPGKFDLIGVDTFEKDNPTADLKIRKEIFWNRLLKK